MKINTKILLFILISYWFIAISIVGVHNIDLAWNMATAPDCMDYNGHIYQDKDDLYRSGSTMIIVGILGTSCFCSLTVSMIDNALYPSKNTKL